MLTDQDLGRVIDRLLILPPFCDADFDDDGDPANGGLPDFVVTIDELLYFFTRFETGC